MEVDVIKNSINDSKWSFIINPEFWENIDTDVKSLIDTDWSEVKFFKDTKEPNEQINTIPNDRGGIYLFIIKPNYIPDTHLYIMYVGRARNTKNQNLRKRCKDYYSESNRPKVKRLLERWWKYIYIKYLPLDDNDIIDKVEEELINAIVPPCNDKIPNKKIQNTIKAFI